MRTFAQTTLLVVILVLGLVLLSGCENPKTGTLYDPNAPSKPQPSISSVSPAGSAFAGMDTIIINGTNFSTTLAENTVYFNAQSASLLKATPTQITLLAPLVTLDSIAVRVSVVGADLFSNSFQYKLQPGMIAYGALVTGEAASSVTTDASGNLYMGFSASSTEAGISKYTTAGARTSYAPGTAGVSLWSSLKMGPGGAIYCVRNVRAVYQFPRGGGGSAVLWTALPTGTVASDIDFDQSGDLWVGGNNSSIFRITQLKVVTSFPFTGVVHSLRVYNGYLYFAAKTDVGEKVWRAQISLTGLGTPEVYFDFAAAYPTSIAQTITFSSDGILYIGTDSPDGIIVVNPNKSFSAPFSAYKGLFSQSFFSFTWGAADDLYATTTGGALLKATIRGKKSATYYGTTF